MRKMWYVFAALLLLGTSMGAFAHTTFDGTGNVTITELTFADDTTQAPIHDETINNPNNIHKGWWYISLKNTTGHAWTNISMTAGVANVAIVNSFGGIVSDDFGITGPSVWSSAAGTISYSGFFGTRSYDDGNGGTTNGSLYTSALETFTNPIAVNQKILLKIYTDNTIANANQFSMLITPNAAVPVPEPTGLITIMSGMVALVGFARRKR